ncbi:hypothetical protein C8R44DRAFT_879446 [Mycena epipterygia]|nr:hypothetical protein C8R44DRAFT_879446 [Mycena epipterygia]
MAPRPWATEEEREWLQQQMDDYRRLQAERKLYLFWPDMQQRWFTRFPESERLGLPPQTEPATTGESDALHAAMAQRRKRLTNWFRHEGRR